MNRFEIHGVKFKPTKISILFIAESAPISGKFFYFDNSNLLISIMEVFQKVYKDISQSTFLSIFKEKGCYLEDLCMDPVNGFTDFKRIIARNEGNPILFTNISKI